MKRLLTIITRYNDIKGSDTGEYAKLEKTTNFIDALIKNEINLEHINSCFFTNSNDSLCIVEGASKDVRFIIEKLKLRIDTEQQNIALSFHNNNSGVREVLEGITNNIISHSSQSDVEKEHHFFRNLLQSKSKESFEKAYNAYFEYFMPKNELDNKLQQLYNLYYNENTPIEKIKIERNRLLSQ